MEVKRVVVGDLQENCYIVSDGKYSLIIDPGSEADKILEAAKDLNVVEVLVTHHHFDHVGALKPILNHYNLEENKRSGKFNYEIILVPGHTLDSKCIYFPDDKIMFTGDFIFYNAIGRTDLGGSDTLMKQSLESMMAYPDDLILYPGHGSSTTLGREKQNFKYYYDN